MLDRLRQRTTDEGGFTLIELLVVILIIGILAAIAIPAFLSQTSKASDSGAKTQVGTLQTTMETYASESNGTYAGATLTGLQAIEPTLNDTSQATPEIVGTPSATEFEVKSTSKATGDEFKLKNKNGEITRTCKVASTTSPGGCKKVSATTKEGEW
jgi:type IV pilus assembly protein PilA